LRITNSRPTPVSIRAVELGSGTVVIDALKVPVNELTVALVAVLVPVVMDSPMSPAKAPVPPVTNEWDVIAAVPPPVSVPLPEKVPNKVPWENMSTKVPLDMNVVRLVKVIVPIFVVVKAPDSVSTPEPVKLLSKTAGLAVAVMVVVPVRVPDEDIESARADRPRPPIVTRAIKTAASERIMRTLPDKHLPLSHSWVHDYCPCRSVETKRLTTPAIIKIASKCGR
jgi:hypothetical protein